MDYNKQIRINLVKSFLDKSLYFVLGFAFAYVFINWKNIKFDISLVLSICVFWLTFYQYYQIRLHNRLSIKPLIMDGSFSSDKEENGIIKIDYAILIKNNGLGLANMYDYKLKMDQKVIKLNELIDKVGIISGLSTLHNNRIIDFNCFLEYFEDGYYLKKDEEKQLLKIQIIANPTRINHSQLTSITNTAIDFIKNHITIEYKYSSLYKEKPIKTIIRPSEI